jgi:NADH-quinone oxidoreductase subunit L
MFGYLWLIPAVPLWGFLVLALTGARLPRRVASIIGVGSIGLSAIITIVIAFEFVFSPPPGTRFIQHLWTWIAVDNFRPGISLYLDALSLIMIFVVTYVGFLIVYYSSDFMGEDRAFSRFFAYMNLFIASMLVLVLADNLLFLLLGWEGVGLCSYLLIGFWYNNPVNGRAAIKAFIMNRIGDVSFLIAIFIIFRSLGTLNIQLAMERAGVLWSVNSTAAVAATILLLGGAVGKSAQLPLQTWLPDAMAGPTPVSALIHAATMVAAGVYLIARLNGLFIMAPATQAVISIIAVFTLLLAGFSAVVQEDIKRVLAYSTISQIGYMFLALGSGAWTAAIYHFISHAFFKALLFLSAGILILSLGHETSMYKMGGLRKRFPVAFWTFLVGALAISGIPPTAGFSSKEMILFGVWNSPHGGHLLWAGALLGVFLTGAYTFRMFFLVFFGEMQGGPEPKRSFALGLPLIVLALFSVLLAALNWPMLRGGPPSFIRFLHSALPPFVAAGARSNEGLLLVFSVLAGMSGIFTAWFFVVFKPEYRVRLSASKPGNAAHRLLFSGWGFDWLYHHLFVFPFVWITHRASSDFITKTSNLIARIMEDFHGLLSLTEGGYLRWYAVSIMLGAIFLLGIIIFL